MIIHDRKYQREARIGTIECAARRGRHILRLTLVVVLVIVATGLAIGWAVLIR